MEKAKEIINEIIKQELETGNKSKRYNERPETLTETINYCALIAERMLECVLNTGYFPLLTAKDVEHIKTLNIVDVVLNVVYPYVLNSRFILDKQKQIHHELEQYECENCLLYLNDSNNTYQQVLNYLSESFINVI